MINPKLNVPISDLPMSREPQDFRDSMHWRVFRVMAELMDGWQFLADFPKNVAIFGSGKIPLENPWYQEAEKLGRLLAENGYNVLTGGGPGIQEAANKGAMTVKANGAQPGQSIGLNVKLGDYMRANHYVSKGIGFHYFFVRKHIMTFSACSYVYFPGGFGTMDNLFGILTQIQTNKVPRMPVILVGSQFWQPLLSWIDATIAQRYETIDQADKELYQILDKAEDIVEVVKTSPQRNEF